jgi:hypothetical protein
MLKIERDGVVYGYLFSLKDAASKYNFLTPPDLALQAGINSYSASEICKAHRHHPKSKEELLSLENQSVEILHLLEGRCEFTFFSVDGQVVKLLILEPGDTVIATGGGHGLKFLTPSKIFECKQGPYSNRERDKSEIEFSNTL